MSESSYRKSVSWFLLILLALYLSGCRIDSRYALPISGFLLTGFPIIDVYASQRMEGELITDSHRVFSSVVVYAILLSLFATIPLYIKKSFENKTLYQYYVLYWLLTSLIFATLFLLLVGIVPSMYGYTNRALCLMLDVLLPALLPAFYQHCKKNTKTTSSSG